MYRKDTQAKSAERPLRDLDEQLAAYYGPALPPRPLAESAWIRLRDTLDQARQVAPRRPYASRPACDPVHRHPVPVVAPGLREAFVDLLRQIDYRRPSPELRCRFSARRTQPCVRGMPLGRRQVRLVLPERGWQFLQAVELEVLLAVGLARALKASRALYLLFRTLCASSVLLALTQLPFAGADHHSLGIVCLAFACCLLGICLISLQERALAFRGDQQAAQWLGRERLCQGLHLLAEHRCPRCCPSWGEPSLAERIARICGSPVQTKDEHLTLVG